MNGYVTVFEIAGGNTCLPWLDRPTYLALGIGAVAVGILLFVLRLMLRGRFRIGLFAPVFLMFWGLGWFRFSPSILATYSHADKLYADYQNRRYDTVEGTVYVLREQPEIGHAPGDLILIGGKEFVINYFRMTPGYRRTISHGGALRNGVYARLCYRDGHILRVDIRGKDGSTNKDSAEEMGSSI